MKQRCRLAGAGLTAALIFVSAIAAAEPPPMAAKEYAKGNARTIAAYIVLLRLRYDLYARWHASGQWPDDKDANAALHAHGEYWQGQLKAGQALLAAGMKGDYWDNIAFIVFEAESLDAARAVVAADPAVKTYVFQAEVRPLDVSFISNRYGAAVP